MEQIESLEKAIKSDAKNLNLLLDLLNYVEEGKSEKEIVASIHSLSRLFPHFFGNGKFADTENEKTKSLLAWLHSALQSFSERLVNIIQDERVSVQIASLNAFMFLIKLCSEKEGSFSNDLLFKLLPVLVCGKNEAAIKAFEEYYLEKYYDIAYYFLRNISRVYKSTMGIDRMTRIYGLLSATKTQASNTTLDGVSFFIDNSSIQLSISVKTFRKAFSDAWLEYLKLDMDAVLHRRVLSALDKDIMPFMSDARLLHDFLTDSYNQGGATSLAALKSLFTLIQKHNLDYPDFYQRLYALLDRNVLHYKLRSQFLKLLDLFLKSTHLPAYLVAAFVKKLVRLTLFASPGSTLAVLPIVHNLLRRHKSCRLLLHRQSTGESIQQSELMLSDPFNNGTSDPAESNALNSSLWELETLSDHYHPEVSNMVKTFQKIIDLKQLPFETENFTQISYSSIIEDELCRNVSKKTSSLNYINSCDIAGGMIAGIWSIHQ